MICTDRWGISKQPGRTSPDDEEEDPETIEDEHQEDIRRSARDLLLVEQAKGWLLGDDGG